MTRTLTIPSLPPPTIFTHNETVHRIPLPPLANFLTDLSAPEQLIKLKDILDRYRTPKSYHRIDVREVDSSEIPHEDPDEERGRSIREEEERERVGRRPVVLPPEVMLDAYLAQRAAELAQNSRGVGEEGEGNGLNEKEGMPSVPLPIPLPMDITAPFPSLPIPIKSYTLPVDLTPLPSGSLSLPPPKRIHPIPPSGPKRRIRELRLDLRTLDAAALFALENWRRDVLGLERMEMEVPDSIWYKEPTPEPEPERMKTGTGKKRGRPRKSRPNEAVEDGEDVQFADGGGVVEDLVSVHIQETVMLGEKEDAAGPSGTDDRHELLKRNDKDVTMGDNLDENHIEVHGTENGHQRTTSKPPTAPPRSPSPDVILHDAYDGKDDADPDFVPPPTPPPRRVTRKARQTAAAAGVKPDTTTQKSATRDIAQDAEADSEAGPSTAKVNGTDSVSRKRGRSSLMPTPPERVIKLSSSSPLKVPSLELQPVASASSSRESSARRKTTSFAGLKQEPISPPKHIPNPLSIALSRSATPAEVPARKRPRRSLVEVIIPQYKPRPRQSLPIPRRTLHTLRSSPFISYIPDVMRAARRSLRGRDGSVQLVDPPMASLARNRRAEQRHSTKAKMQRGPRRSGAKVKRKEKVIVLDDNEGEEELDEEVVALEDEDMEVDEEDGAGRDGEEGEEEEEPVQEGSQTSEGEWGFLKGISG